MSNNYSAPPPPRRDAEGNPLTPQLDQQYAGQAYPGQQHYPGPLAQPPAPQPPHGSKNLFIVSASLPPS